MLKNKTLSFTKSLVPIIILICFLTYNIFFLEGEMLGKYSNQIILIISAITALIIGFFNQTPYKHILLKISENLKNVFSPILILFLVGALSGAWLISGIIPAMIYYGLQILNPDVFLPASVIIAALVSITTGSSWTTSATVGIALIGIGNALNINSGIIAGAVISGAYFGDKMSPLSDTTNLAATMVNSNLFTHIRYMSITTIPTIVITLIIFTILNATIQTSGNTDINNLLETISKTFFITPWLFLIPLTVLCLILLKTKPLIALSIGVLFAIIVSYFFQSNILHNLASTRITSISNSIFVDTQIYTENERLNTLFSSGGMKGMLGTVYLVICAMIFGGIMEAIGALDTITKTLLSLVSSIFGLFASTVISCLGLNIITSDQYLSIVIPGKMFKKSYHNKHLAPENLSRTLEDSGTVTSVLIPWNTCGAYQSSVLGVNVNEYFIYAFFNWLSPFSTLLFAALNIKIRYLASNRFTL